MKESIHGILLRGIGSFYTAEGPDGTLYTLRCQKKIRREHMSPLVGDEILFTPGNGEEYGWLEEILPRRTECLRPPVANVDTLVLVVSPIPEPDLMLCDRLIARAYAQGMNVLIAANKTDLDENAAGRLMTEYRNTEIPIYPVSAKTGEGLERLREAMTGSVCCMTGQSGAGKSTLLNVLMGLQLDTGKLSEKIERGKNTTRHAELLRGAGLRVMDTAGFSLLETEKELPPEHLKERYPEYLPWEGKCRFSECLHDREPGCAVAEAVGRGELSAERWERYRLLLAEIREAWRNRYD